MHRFEYENDTYMCMFGSIHYSSNLVLQSVSFFFLNRDIEALHFNQRFVLKNCFSRSVLCRTREYLGDAMLFDILQDVRQGPL